MILDSKQLNIEVKDILKKLAYQCQIFDLDQKELLLEVKKLINEELKTL